MIKVHLGVWIYIFLMTYMHGSLAVRVDKFGLSDGMVPEKGSNISIKCDVTISASDGIQSLDILKGTEKVFSCFIKADENSICSKFPVTPARYSVTYTHPSVIITITVLHISDGGTWYCGFQTTGNTLYTLPVYASPKSLVGVGGTDGGDLQSEQVSLCLSTSNCVFPSVEMYQWLYKKGTGQWLLYQNSTPASSQIGCSGSEKKYSSTLQLPRYTVWPLQPSNTETTVKFKCRIDFPSLQSPLESEVSGDVTYAVRVTSVTLKDGTKTPSNSDTIEVVTGETKTLTCVTSTSRPVATIVWYIELDVKQKSTSTVYIYSPKYEDNNKQIYCKAFNIQTEVNAVSSNFPKLNVRVKVTAVTLFDGNISPQDDDTIEVTENQEKTLTCRTGDSNPPSIIMWFINDQLKQNGTNVNFKFIPTNNDHDMRIQCKAYNSQPPNEAVVSSSPKLFVKAPVLTAILTDGNVSLSGRLEVTKDVSKTLTCSTGVSRPTPTIIWYIDAKELKRSTNNTSSLTIIPEKDLNGTEVFCKAFNIQPENQAVSSLNITLYVKDTIFFVDGKEGRQDVFVDEYEADITFVCQVYSFLKYHVRIMFQDKVLKEQTQTYFLSYTHSSVTCFDAGVYSCKGNNQHGQAPNANINLFVRCSPRPLQQLKHNFTSKLHTTATLSFTAIAYPEPGPAGFVWHKEIGIRLTALRSNTDLQIFSTGLQSNLTILNVSSADYGQYRLTATNIIGSYEQYLFLVQEDNKESKTYTENVTSETCQAELIIGISCGVLVIALIFYGTVVTLLLKRERSKKGTQLFDELNKKTNYVNLAEDESAGRQNDPTGRNDISGRNEEDSVKLYTDLARYSKGEGSTYDIIQKS